LGVVLVGWLDGWRLEWRGGDGEEGMWSWGAVGGSYDKDLNVMM